MSKYSHKFGTIFVEHTEKMLFTNRGFIKTIISNEKDTIQVAVGVEK